MKEKLKLLPGSIALCCLVYWYVFKQVYLVSNHLGFCAVLFFGVSFSFLFTIIDAALMSIKEDDQYEKYTQEMERLSSEYKAGKMTGRDYNSLSKLQTDFMDTIYNAEKFNASNVVLSSAVPVLTSALLSAFLWPKIAIHPIVVDFCRITEFSAQSTCTFEIPGAGKETFLFFSLSLLVIVLGKVLPKLLGRRHNATVIRSLQWVITKEHSFFGWIARPMLAIVDKRFR